MGIDKIAVGDESAEPEPEPEPERESVAEPEVEPTREKYNWYAEIEFRRWLRRRMPADEKDRRFYPFEPDPEKARWRTSRDYASSIEAEAVEVSDEKVVVPIEITHELPADELQEWVIENVLDRMYVRDVGGTVQKGSIDSGHMRPDTRFSDDDRPVDPRPVYVEVPPDHELCELNELWQERRRDNRDMKMLITARDSATGTGKTTLAVALAKYWDEHGWDASKATLSPKQYVDKYTDLESGEILIGDEMEQMADPRRSMSEQNLTLTQYWSTMRQWEVSTICTLPSVALVDKRLRELMDIRINVINRGTAVVYKKKVDDHSGEVKEKRLHRVRWGALDDDLDYRELAAMKREHMENFNETAYFRSDGGEMEKQDPETAVREYRDERIRAMSEAGYTQKEIAEVFDISRPRVSQILNEGGE